MATKFSDVQIDEMVGAYVAVVGEDYEARSAIVKELADKFDVTVNSIRGKLNAEGVYKKKEVVAKATTKADSKEELVVAIEAIWGVGMKSMRNMTVKDLKAFWGRFLEMSAVRDANEGKK